MTKRDKDNLMRYARVRGKKTDHKYLDLFRAIEEQKTYHEPSLKTRFQMRNFSEAKKHLSQLILKVLRIYNDHPETEMQNELTEIRILMDRSLHHFALKKIKNARIRALREERFQVLHTLTEYELRVLPFVVPPKELNTHRNSILALRDEADRQQSVIHRLYEIQDKDMSQVLNQSFRSGKYAAEMVRELENMEELHAKDEHLPFRARSTKYRVWNVIRHQQLDFAGRSEVLAKQISLFEKHPFLIREEPVRHIFSLGGYGMCLNVVGRHEEALAATEKLRELKTDSPQLRRSVFLNYTTNISIYTLNTGDTAPFNQSLAFLMAGLKEHGNHTPPGTLSYIYYLLSIDFWLSGDIRRANRFARRVVNEPSGRANLIAACRCFLLVFAYEQSEPDQVLQYVRNWKRSWKKKKTEYQIEMLFADFMVRFLDVTGQEERRNALDEITVLTDAALAGGFKVRADNFVFLQHWLQAQLEHKTLGEVVRAGGKG